MHVQVCCEGHSTAKEEDGVERIRDEHEHGRAGEAFVDRAGDEVDE